MDGLELQQEMQELIKSLSDSYTHLWKKGKEHALAEHHYKVANKKECFRLHEEDKVAWTACQSLAHGSETVADLRLARDLAKVEYEVMNEKVMGLKLQIRILESEISRIWGNQHT